MQEAVVRRLSGGEVMVKRYTAGAGRVTVTVPPGCWFRGGMGIAKRVLPGVAILSVGYGGG